jgi:hypothetical protein
MSGKPDGELASRGAQIIIIVSYIPDFIVFQLLSLHLLIIEQKELLFL